MDVTIPETPREFFKAMGERSLRNGAREVFGIDLPDHLCTDEQYTRAGEEWKNAFQEALKWLKIASSRALAHLPDLLAANASFIVDIQSIAGLREFYSHPRHMYLNELVYVCREDVQKLEKLLKLFVELAK